MYGTASMDEITWPCSTAVAIDWQRDYSSSSPVDHGTTSTLSRLTTPQPAAGTLSLSALPSELIDHVLSYLSPIDLASVSLVNRLLHAHSIADYLWQSMVQENVPGVKVTTPYPCATFRELYVAHDPRWFLTKYKLWFCDRDLTGKLIIVRYDERRGVIEGYQLLANTSKPSKSSTSPALMGGTDVEIHEFEPEIKLHLDKPVLQMRANSLENAMRATAGTSSIAAETPMPLVDSFNDTMFSTFMLARSIPDSLVSDTRRQPFPTGDIWPPATIPASERVSATHYMRDGVDLLGPVERPAKRSEISQKSFRIRSWMEMRSTGLRDVNLGLGSDWSLRNGSSVLNQASRPWLPNYASMARSSFGVHIADHVTTYSTLEPHLYTPSLDQPWRGIWVGDYSGHGCEFLFINQEHPTPFDETAFEAFRLDDETDAAFEQRKADARRYRGRLEAIKLTGDPNVPRGECTFVADDLGEEGYVTTVEHHPFKGARVVESRGHIARTGFVNDRYIRSQLILISENRLAQFWVGFNHISFFERVDIDGFLVPQ